MGLLDLHLPGAQCTRHNSSSHPKLPSLVVLLGPHLLFRLIYLEKAN